MANPEHVDILRQGVEVWNAWREEHPDIQPDLSEADLRQASLREVNFWETNLWGANISFADLSDALLSGADLGGSDLSSTHLSNADLSGAHLSGADLNSADLSGADFSGAMVLGTVFGNVDLSTVKGLEAVEHIGHSSIGIDTIYRSGGNIPEAFLRGAGIDDTFIEYILPLGKEPTQYYTCFISYSSKDQAFAERLYTDLQSNNVRCWYAPEDLKIGDKFRVRIDESIRLYDKLLLILSEHSVRSPWVETEVETAFSKEHKTGKLALFPVKLDDTVEETEEAWAATIHRTRHIGDFTHWKEHDEYQGL